MDLTKGGMENNVLVSVTIIKLMEFVGLVILTRIIMEEPVYAITDSMEMRIFAKSVTQVVANVLDLVLETAKLALM